MKLITHFLSETTKGYHKFLSLLKKDDNLRVKPSLIMSEEISKVIMKYYTHSDLLLYNSLIIYI